MNGSTPQQQRAIGARGNVLVQAGAGAGKTRTLVQRAVAWLLADRANTLDQILMVTFTEAAATEMRLRIRSELTAALATRPGDSHLAEQLALLETAHISTLHSFCLRLVRQHFYELELDPQLAVLPEAEARLLAEEVFDEILAVHYAGDRANSAAVQELIQTHARGREQPIRRLVLRLHEYAQTLPDPAGWFAAELEKFRNPAPHGWAEWLREILPAWRNDWLPELRPFADHPVVAVALAALESLLIPVSLPAAHAGLTRIREADTAEKAWPRGTVGKVRDRIETFFDELEFLQSLTGADATTEAPRSAPPLGAMPTSAPAPHKREAHLPSETTPHQTFDASADVSIIPPPLAEDWSWSRGAMVTLLELAREFGAAFAGAKREMGAVDFHDLEQCALRLLWNAAAQRATPLAEDWRRRLQLIFVDEYQDINAAQDAILTALGREGAEGNRFLVGDVKQSIYRFRLADPHIFQTYADTWGQDPSLGAVVPLSENFRSHEAILEFINPFFAALLRRDVGGVEFGPDARLQFGNREGRASATRAGDFASGPTPAGAPAPHVELHLRLLSRGGKNETEAGAETDNEIDPGSPLADISNAEAEARLIGHRLLTMRADNFQVWDEDENCARRLAWRDVVILLRSRKNKVEAFAKEFARLGIPLVAPRGGFFDCPEVLDLLNLLALLDNPLQDIETIAVLRSPIVGLSLDELAMIRLAAKGRFWTAVRRFLRARGAGAEAGDVAEEIPAGDEPPPATRARDGRAASSESNENPGPTSAPNSSPAPPAAVTPEDGALVAKLDRFLRRFEGWRRLARQHSLSRCLEQILQDTQYPAWLLTQPRGAQRQANILKLLTWARQFDQFHRQGLFRFLRFIDAQRDAEIDAEPAPAETGDAVRLMTVHQSKGLEFRVVVVADLGKRFNLQDLSADIILDEKYGLCPKVRPPFTSQNYPSLPHWLAQRRQHTEALGEEIRVLYVALTRACHTLMLVGTASRSRAEKHWPEGTLTTRAVLRARHALDWLGPWLQHATGKAEWFAEPAGASPLIRWTIYDREDAAQDRRPPAVTTESSEAAQPSLDAEAWQALEARLRWQYPFAAATTEPAKASVSALRRRVLEEADDEVFRLPFAWPGKNGSTERPDRGGLTAIDVGTAHHRFLERMDLGRLGSVAELDAEARRLQQAGVLTPEERAALDLEKIAVFWTSATGRKLLGHREQIQREMPFTVRLSGAELAALTANAAAISASAAEPGKTRGPRAPLVALPNELVIVQGVVDLAVLLPQEIWLLDFKTDVASAPSWRDKARHYAPQLKLYAHALSRIYHRPVTHCWLHFLNAGETLECSEWL